MNRCSNLEGSRETDRQPTSPRTGQSPIWTEWSRSRRDLGAAETQRAAGGTAQDEVGSREGAGHPGSPGPKGDGLDAKSTLRTTKCFSGVGVVGRGGMV